MTITLDDNTLAALNQRAKSMGVEVESMTNELLITVIADESAALNEFEAFIRPRIDEARSREFTQQSVDEIFEAVRQARQ